MRVVTITNFQYKTLLEQRKMTLAELQEYFILLRKVEFERQTMYDLKIRKRIYVLIKFLLKIDRILSGRSLKIVNNKSYATNRGKIYVCTSSSVYDVPNMFEVVNGLSWTVKENMSDEKNNDAIELLLRANLLTFFDSSKEDIHVIQNRLYKNLAVGGNEICFPEIVDLKSYEDDVAPLTEDFVKRVVEAKVSIIPVAILDRKDGKKGALVNIGKNLEIGEVSSNLYHDVERIVRDDLISLKGEMLNGRALKKVMH